MLNDLGEEPTVMNEARISLSRRISIVSAIMLSSCAIPAFAQDTPAEEAEEDAHKPRE